MSAASQIGDREAGLATVLASAFSLALQVQLPVMLGSTPLRLAASDLLLLVASPGLAFLLLRYRRALAELPRPTWMLFLLLATGVVLAGSALGAARVGFTSWAMGKTVGWFVLLAYGAAGLLLGFVASARAADAAARWLIIGAVFGIAAYVILHILGRPWPVINEFRFSGFLSNPNAAALLLLCALALALPRGSRDWRWTLTAGVLAAGVLFTRSVAGLGGLVMVLLVFLLLQRKLQPVLGAVAVGAALFTGAGLLNTAASKLLPKITEEIRGERISTKVVAFAMRRDEGKRRMFASSVPARIESARQAIDLWQKYPLFGAGIGTFLAARQAEATPQRPAMVIHSTPLWVLTAFGLLGLTVFAALFLTLGFWLIRALPADVGVAALLMLAGWATMGIAHELLYQRMPWFLLGLSAGAISYRHASAGISSQV